MRIVTIGDVMLDVVVRTRTSLRDDDDTDATIRVMLGGQAANVAAWAVALGASATVVGPRGSSVAASIVGQRLSGAGVEYVGIDSGDVGTVVSIVAGGTRTMASDAGPSDWVASLRGEQVPDADVLHVSGYPLLRAADPTPLVLACAAARSRGMRVSVDLASAALIGEYGAPQFAAAVRDLSPDVVFATRDEWSAVDSYLRSLGAAVVVKNGSRDVALIDAAGERVEYPVPPAQAVDPTGAGDALAAGYLVGGVELGMRAAARCVAAVGAQPA
jgi:sugar/nucleoside kinase (ribokinase family)